MNIHEIEQVDYQPNDTATQTVALKELIKGGGAGSGRPSVAEFREKLTNLSKPATSRMSDEENDARTIDKATLFEAVGKPDRKIDIGDGEHVTWY